MRSALEKHCHDLIEELASYGKSYYISFRGKNKQPVLVDGNIVVARGWNGIQNKLMSEYFKLCDEVYQ